MSRSTANFSSCFFFFLTNFEHHMSADIFNFSLALNFNRANAYKTRPTDNQNPATRKIALGGVWKKFSIALWLFKNYYINNLIILDFFTYVTHSREYNVIKFYPYIYIYMYFKLIIHFFRSLNFCFVSISNYTD